MAPSKSHSIKDGADAITCLSQNPQSAPKYDEHLFFFCLAVLAWHALLPDTHYEPPSAAPHLASNVTFSVGPPI